MTGGLWRPDSVYPDESRNDWYVTSLLVFAIDTANSLTQASSACISLALMTVCDNANHRWLTSLAVNLAYPTERKCVPFKWTILIHFLFLSNVVFMMLSIES